MAWAKNDPLSVQRGDYGRNVFPTLLFVLGRAISGPLQYYLITSHPLSRFGVPPYPTGEVIPFLHYEIQKFPLIIALLTVLLSSKHNFWQLFMCQERMTLGFSFFAILADGIYESLCSLVFTAASLNPLWSERWLYIGAGIFVVGVCIEMTAELQRFDFKTEAENKGKLFTAGLWSLSRHINYFANVCFGFGFGLATGSWPLTPLTTGMYLSNFIYNAIPSIEAYCAEKYGKQWERYVENVPYALIPGVY